MSTGTRADADRAEETTQTTVEVRATGHVRTELGEHDFAFTFEGDRLREFLEQLFAEHPALEDLLIARTEAEATTRGWAPAPAELPGGWKKNPEGEQTRSYARVTVNGKFNEHLQGFDTRLEDGDRVGLLFPFIFCC